MSKLVKESLNEAKQSKKSKKEVLLGQREKLVKQLEKAKADYKKAVDKEDAFIEKYGQKAWDNNMRYYSDGHNAWKYAQMRYPGKAAWNGEGPIMRAQNDAAERKSYYEEQIKEIDKKIATLGNNKNEVVKQYYGEYETATCEDEDNMMDQLWGIIDEFVQNVSYGQYIEDRKNPAYGKALRDMTVDEITDNFFNTYGDQLTREQIEEVVIDVYNLEYLDGYKDDDGNWIFPEK